MIYNDSKEYKIKFFKDLRTGEVPVKDYILSLAEKDRAKVLKYIRFLKDNKGILDEPYSKHIKGKIRELRVDFARNHHRIFFFTFIDKNIILLSAFLKKTAQTSESEIRTAEINYFKVINNQHVYED